MEKKLGIKIFFVFFLAFILIFEISNVYAQRYDVVLIGKFIDLNEQGNNKTYELWTDEDKWRFTVTESHVLNYTSLSGWGLLSKINPRKLKLSGNKEIFRPLEQPEIIGRTFKLRGKFHHMSKVFILNSVEEVVEEKSSKKEKKK